MIRTIALLSICFAVAHGGIAEVLNYKIDPVHSGITFKVRHFFNKVPGVFNSFEGNIAYDPDNAANNSATAIVKVSSIDTRNEDRDSHLQNDDFFHAAEHPLIEFTSTEWIAQGDNLYLVKGLLKMAGVEKEIQLDVSYLGEMEGRGKMISGWEGSTVINRDDWGISYGKPAIGEEVEIELNIQAHR